jgi:hypothetical protein
MSFHRKKLWYFPFNLEIVRMIAELRMDGSWNLVTYFFIFWTTLGDELAHIIIIGLFYWVVDKQKIIWVTAMT